MVGTMVKNGVTILSTGGTADFIENLGLEVTRVEQITGYPSILGGRVKTLHPAVFAGILAKREQSHLDTLKQYDLPPIDCVIVDLYPFEETVAAGGTEEEIIEKIDIGGISLIRAAAKNYRDVVVVPSRNYYPRFESTIKYSDCKTTSEQRKELALAAFKLTSAYDMAIADYFNSDYPGGSLNLTHLENTPLRYGENPHQKASFYGKPRECIRQLSGKAISYNNLLDIDAALRLMSEFSDDMPTVAVFKHNNSCGMATRPTISEAWKDALKGDPLSAFGGIICANTEVDYDTAVEIDKIFYEVLLAPSFSADALEFLRQKKKRILLELKGYPGREKNVKSCLNGFLVQDEDHYLHQTSDWVLSTQSAVDTGQMKDLYFANRVVKHLKSNAIVLVKDQMIVGMGAGQTSRVDALKQAIEKAGNNELPLKGAVMASDAFFPFSDCVEIAHGAGINAVVQPGGSLKDKDSIDYCDANGMAMYLTGIRHFKH